jgi:PAS domain S-box-containing protein
LTIAMTAHHDHNLAAIRRLLTAVPALFIGLGSDRRVFLWNPLAEAALGCREKDVLGLSLEHCSKAWEVDRVLSGLAECARSGRPVRIDGVRCDRDGETPVELGLTVIPLGEDGLYGVRFVIIGADVTERRRLEEQLAQAQKMQAIGHLAAGIAHEISTPAQFVGDNTHFLQDAFADFKHLLDRGQDLAQAVRGGRSWEAPLEALDTAAEALDLDYLNAEVPLAIEHILDGVQRISKIVRSMKFFAHPGDDAEKKPIDLNAAIESTIVISRNEWKYVAEMKTDLDPGLPMVVGRRGEINQVLLNLVTNAAHAIAAKRGDCPAAKGTIRITSRRREAWVEIRIADSGAGIPESLRSKVFDLFFTTKEEGCGSGQGLAIAHAVIVEKHGGELTFESEPGEGTTFCIRLPVDEGGHGHA